MCYILEEKERFVGSNSFRIVAKALMGYKEEFESVAMPHVDAVYKAAFVLCSNRDEAEDLVQSTFLKAFERFDSFKRGTNCKAWLLRILRNSWIDQLRHKGAMFNVVRIEENMVSAPNGDRETAWSDCRDLLENFADKHIIEALKELPDEQRLTLFLIDVEQLTQGEVAEIMSVAVGTVKSRTSRARTALKKKLLSHSKELGYIGGEQ